MTQFLISCEFVDAAPMSICLEGLKAHAEVEAFPLWLVETSPPKTVLMSRLPHLQKLEETWVVSFPTHASLECFVNLVTSINFKAESYIRIVEAYVADDCFGIWALAEFHKAVMVDKIFAVDYHGET